MDAKRFAVTWLVLAALYWLLAGQLSVTEGIAGAIAVTVAAVFAALAERCADKRFDLHGPWLRVIFVPLAALVTDSAIVARALLQAIFRRPAGAVGAVYHQGFRIGGDGDRDVGRRALVTLAASLAPNGVVVRVLSDEDAPGAGAPGAGALLLHRLVAALPRADAEWPL